MSARSGSPAKREQANGSAAQACWSCALVGQWRPYDVSRDVTPTIKAQTPRLGGLGLPANGVAPPGTREGPSHPMRQNPPVSLSSVSISYLTHFSKPHRREARKQPSVEPLQFSLRWILPPPRLRAVPVWLGPSACLWASSTLQSRPSRHCLDSRVGSPHDHGGLCCSVALHIVAGRWPTSRAEIKVTVAGCSRIAGSTIISVQSSVQISFEPPTMEMIWISARGFQC